MNAPSGSQDGRHALPSLRATGLYVLEIGAYILFIQLLFDPASQPSGWWDALLQTVLPILLILALRWWNGDRWRVRDLGFVRPGSKVWIEASWLLCFQTACQLGILLYLARFRFYDLLNFLEMARNRLNGYPASYGGFLFSLSLFLVFKAAWGGELLHRGYAQGLGTIRFSAAGGGFISWFLFGVSWSAMSLKLGYPALTAALWGVVALFPGPLPEAFYFRNATILPLIAIRAASSIIAFGSTGFFLYWYPHRSFAVAMPVFCGFLVLLALLSIAGARRLHPYWLTAGMMLWAGFGRGALPGLGLAIVLLANTLVSSQVLRMGSFVGALILLRVCRAPVRPQTQQRNLGVTVTGARRGT